MLTKACTRLASWVIRALQPQLQSVYPVLKAFIHQRNSLASWLGPGTRWTTAAISSLVVIWLLWGLHGQQPSPCDGVQRKLDPSESFNHAMIPIIKPQKSSQSVSLHSKPRPLPIGDGTIGFPNDDFNISPQSGSLLSKFKPPSISDITNGVGKPDRPLILYAYAESENARINLEFFLKKGLHGRADFVFIINGEASEAVKLIPKLFNVMVVQRDNSCYDIGAFGKVLRSQIKVGSEGAVKDGVQLWQRYKKFITMNASIRGPFLPVWSEECWTDAFIRKLNDQTKLVGLSYHCNPSPHLQSMLLATDHIGMSILLDPGLAFSVPNNDPPHGTVDDPVGYSRCYADFNQAVHSEIGMARLIQSQGYKVDAMLTSVHVLGAADYCEKAAYPTDHLWNGMYFGFNVHPYEMLFMKANRDIDPELMKRMTEWHLRSRTSSWDTCRR
ncbi:hypothetical protein VM1G_10987 [Cytospora mali]|uniref:Uncharacterized protein n=1 Tax=Cytospora mali TaxID=578113 RepID=A0A194VK27_CYTMA|nr:hypothetical protein VM1G_10987 [Valsa mali]